MNRRTTLTYLAPKTMKSGSVDPQVMSQVRSTYFTKGLQ